jgi:predicted enzyme related to lactoylglutathione lyase
MTYDADGAAAFYGAVVGWSFSAHDPASPVDYRHITRSDGQGQGGVLPLTAEMKAQGARPAWVPYFYAPDVDGMVDAILADGGHALGPRMDIAEGRFTMVTDPFGTPFYLMAPKPPEGREGEGSTVFSPDKVQTVRWHELASPDLAGAKAFYAKHLGFAFNDVMPMGPMGDYCFIDHDGLRLGAIMPRNDQSRPPLWLLYFGVPSASEAKAAIEAAGGQVLNGPHEVPGGDWIVIATDPQGALFGVVGPKGD